MVAIRQDKIGPGDRGDHPEGVTSEGDDTRSRPPRSATAPRHFRQLPDLAIPDDADAFLGLPYAIRWRGVAAGDGRTIGVAQRAQTPRPVYSRRTAYVLRVTRV